MVQVSLLFLTLTTISASVTAAPLTKRIAQVISDSTSQWETACDTAGGGQQCNQISVDSAATLLANAGPCDQQNAADNMVDLAKTLNNDPDMIKLAQIFAQQPRNSPDSLSIPYCQQTPKNTELNGLFQCQFQGDDPKNFAGGAKAGEAGTIPFGTNAPLSPAGSCPANTNGPIADGTQLLSITQDPGVGSASSPPSSSSNSTSTDNGSGDDDDGSDENNGDGDDSTSTSIATPSSSSAAAVPSGSSSSFALQNGQDAQKLNQQFDSLTADSSCTDGEQACVNGGFAQCVQSKFVVTQCAASLTCVALPLVNSAGTSIACTTTADAQARIAATGAQGGITGS